MHNFFYNIFLKIKANKWFSSLFFVLFLVGCLFFANRLKFEEDITRIIPKDEKNDAITKVISQLKFADKVAVIIEKDKAGTIDDMTAQATDFVDSIQTLNQYYNDIQGQYDIDNFASVNHTYSNQIGNKVLNLMGDRILNYFFLSSIYRMGDRFAILIDNAIQKNSLKHLILSFLFETNSF